jgi:hypothetical protein
MTVRWHVDDLMISHTSNKATSQFLCALKDIYGDNLAETIGSVHDYLGMIFDFSEQDKVKINMTEYLLKVVSLRRLLAKRLHLLGTNFLK